MMSFQCPVALWPAPLTRTLFRLTQEITSGDPRLELSATRGFRKILSVEKNPPVQQVLHAEVLGHFVRFLARQDLPELQFEAAWALTNIASTEYTRVSQHGRRSARSCSCMCEWLLATLWT
jgi:hypothetical protein